MKRLYSIILLFSFLTGALQPILPMIEYEMFRGNILELLGSEEADPGTVHDNLVYTPRTDQCGDQPTEQNLLDDDYYPLAVQLASIPQPGTFSIKTRLYLPAAPEINGPAYLPNPPPPRLS